MSEADKWQSWNFGMMFVFKAGPDGVDSIPWCSVGCEELFELPAEALSDSMSVVFDRVHPEDLMEIRKTMRACFEKQQPWSLEFRVLLPAKGLRWIKGMAVPETGSASGKAEIWRGLMIDITSQKNEQDSAKMQADMLREVANRSPSAMFVAIHDSESSHKVLFPFVSQGMHELLGIDANMAMADPVEIKSVFDPSQQILAKEAFVSAREDGESEALLQFSKKGESGSGLVKLSLLYCARDREDSYWLGTVEPIEHAHGEPIPDGWSGFLSFMEGKINAVYLSNFSAGLSSLGFEQVQVEWFEEPLLWQIEKGAELEKLDGSGADGLSGYCRAVLDDSRRPIGRLDFKVRGELSPEASKVLAKACKSAWPHWEAHKHERELEIGFESMLLDMEKSSRDATIGSLMGGLAHDLSSPLGNGALSIEVAANKIGKIARMLTQDKLRKSEATALVAGAQEIALSALAEINKARELLDSVKKVVGGHQKPGAAKNELGKVLRDIRQSLHPTLRKRGVELSIADSKAEIWANLDVSEMFQWLVKSCLACGGNKPLSAEKSRLLAEPYEEGGIIGVRLFFENVDASQLARELGSGEIHKLGSRNFCDFKLGVASKGAQ